MILSAHYEIDVNAEGEFQRYEMIEEILPRMVLVWNSLWPIKKISPAPSAARR